MLVRDPAAGKLCATLHRPQAGPLPYIEILAAYAAEVCDEREPCTDREPLRLGRSAATRRIIERRRAHGARQRPCLLPGAAVSARARGQSPRAFRSRNHQADP